MKKDQNTQEHSHQLIKHITQYIKLLKLLLLSSPPPQRKFHGQKSFRETKSDALRRKGEPARTEVPSPGCCHPSCCAAPPGMPDSAPGALPHSPRSTNTRLGQHNPLTWRNPILLCSCGQTQLLPPWPSQEAGKALCVTRSPSTRGEDCSRTGHPCKKRSL